MRTLSAASVALAAAVVTAAAAAVPAATDVNAATDTPTMTAEDTAIPVGIEAMTWLVRDYMEADGRPEAAAGQREAAAEASWLPVATFSILGYDPETGEVGGAVQSRVFSVGNGVLWAEADVGAVVTQAYVDVSYGPQALELLEEGLDPSDIVSRVLEADPDPNPENWPKAARQFAVMNAAGEVEAFTGPEAPDWAGHRTGRYVSAQGNILAGPEVVESMVKAFEETEGHLSFRLQAALEAGQAAGGDTRGMQSAAMLIVKKDGGVWLNNDVVLRLQVDDHPEPIAELRRLVEIAGEQRERFRR